MTVLSRQKASANEARAGRDSRAATRDAVSVSGVSKGFVIPHHSVSTLKERALHPFRRSGHERLQALKNVSFDVRKGEFFAVIGRNGSGKSTLLKCLAGIYRPDAGEIAVRGRLSPFIELGVGFNPDLNAADNVTVNATLIGLTPREARARFDEIVAFAELEDFVDMKLKNYSSGMQVRLGFATAIQVDADVLLVDEVLAVGDALFQRKCFDTFERLRAEGRTIIYVSHDLGTVRKLADRAVLLEEGEAVALGEPNPVIAEYERRNSRRTSRDRAQSVEGDQAPRFGDGDAEVIDAWFEDGDGHRTVSLNQGEDVTFKLRARFHREMRDPVLAFNVRTPDHVLVLNVNNVWNGSDAGVVPAGDERTLVVRFPNWLGGGRYRATPIVAHAGGRQWADLRDGYLEFEVEAPTVTAALVDIPCEAEVVSG